MRPILLEHRNGSLYALVDTIGPVQSEGELSALAAQIGEQVPVFGLSETMPTRSSNWGGALPQMLQGFKHNRRNMLELRVFLQWRGDFSPHIEHDSYVISRLAYLVYNEQVKLLQVKIEPDVTLGNLVDYVRNKSVGDLIEFMTEDECAAMELAGLVVPVAGNAADAAAAVCYAYKGELVNALVSTVMIFVPGFIQAGIVAVRRGRGFAHARAAAKAAEQQRQALLEAYRRSARQAVETRGDQLRKLDELGADLPVGTAPTRGARLDQGNFTEVFLSGDGRMVLKQVRTRIGHPGKEMPISRDEQIAIAARTVEQHRILREAGYPVPKSWVSPADPTIIVQQRAPGIQFADLPADVQAHARGSASGLKNGPSRSLGVEIDNNQRNIVQNMLFDAHGNVTAWYDPGIPLDVQATSGIGSRMWAAGAM